MKLCVFQGTFNPIHSAHLRLAKYVKSNFNYDKILFIPAYKPPHKSYDSEISFHRLNMVKLALEKFDGFEVSDIEYERETPSYTYLTILELKKRFKIYDKIGFIIGTDAFEKIESWYESDKLKNDVNFLLFKRNDTINVNLLALLSKKGYKFNMMDMDFLNISSTVIREKVKHGESINGMLPQSVMEYIEKNGLYRN